MLYHMSNFEHSNRESGFLEGAFFETTGVNETNRWLEENGYLATVRFMGI